MPFRDYSPTPASNLTIGDNVYIGPNMARDDVREAFQTLAADGRDLYDDVEARVALAKGDPGANGSTIGPLPQFQRLLAKLQNGNEDASVVVLGDSTGDANTEWPYLFGAAIAAAYPAWTVRHRLWNSGATSYDAYTTIATGSGSRILTIWNGSVAGQVGNYFAGDRFTAGVKTPAPDLVFHNYGHNGDNDGASPAERLLDYSNGIAARLNTELATVPVIVIGQNPARDDSRTAAKVPVFRAFAARNGYGFIDIHAAFLQSGVALNTLMGDNIHPNATGSQLWADTVMDYLTASLTASGGPSFGETILLGSAATYTEFSRWTLSGGATLAKDAVNYQTRGHAVSLASVGVAGSMSKQVISGEDVIALRGKPFTVLAYMIVPSGNDGSSGRIDIVDSAGTTSASGVVQGTGFAPFSATRVIDAGATGTITVYIWAAAAAATNTIKVDRVTWSIGHDPVDTIATSVVGREMTIAGASSTYLGSLYNSAATDVGLRFIGTESANPASAWTADFNTDGFAAKQAGDTTARAYLKQDGVYLGGGAGAPDLRIGRAGAGRFQFLGGSVEPDTDNARDLGISGAAWRNIIFGSAIYRNAVQVVGARKTGWATATGTATRTTFDTATVTLPQLAERMKALIDDLHGTAGHGLIGT